MIDEMKHFFFYQGHEFENLSVFNYLFEGDLRSENVSVQLT